MRIFGKPMDYAAFVKILEQGRQRIGMRVLGYCLMGNHWHLVLWPRRAEDLSRFMQWITSTHVRRWREHRRKVGEGHLYQGRFKSFPVQDDHHLLTVLRYVEANPLRARMVEQAQDWPWTSMARARGADGILLELEAWPVDRPSDWAEIVNRRLATPELLRLRLSVNRGQPYGQAAWIERIAQSLGLQSTLRDPWRPKKNKTRRKRRKDATRAK
jgi:putative transposase